MGLWKRRREDATVRDIDTEKAREELVRAREETIEVIGRSTEIRDLTDYLATRRQQNHFGDALDISFKPRRRHA